MTFKIKTLTKLVGIVGFGLLVTSCAPEVGSKEWCEVMKEKPKADWSANEAKDFAKSCVF